MKPYTDYTFFQIEDFLADADFKEWIENHSPEKSAYFRGLIVAQPQLKQTLENARLIALGIATSQVRFSEVYKETLFDKIESQIQNQPTQFSLSRRFAFSIAASIAVFLMVGFGFYAYYLKPQTLQTSFAEIQHFTLYDGSEITLNANSVLEVPSRFDWNKKRIVRLKGEAYFKVSKEIESTKKYRKFTVATNSGEVEVYGTMFNVYARNNEMNVLLDEGKVKIIDTKSSKVIDLKPTQFFESGVNQALSRITQKPTAQSKEITAWKQNLLVFNDASMEELTHRVAEVYGVELVLRGEVFANQQFQGELPVNNLEEALLILSTSFGQKAIRENDKIFFVPNQ